MSESGEKRNKRFRHLPLLEDLTEAQRSLLAGLMREERYQPGERILSLEEESSDLFLVEQGKVVVFRETPFGEQPFAELAAGALFGELSMLDERGRSADVKARTSAIVWRLEGAPLQELLKKEGELAYRFYRFFWRSLAQRIYLANGYLQKFFVGAEGGGGKRKPVRPMWFAPPEGLEEAASQSELPATGRSQSPVIPMNKEEKRDVLQKAGLSEKEGDLLFEHGEEVALHGEEALFHEGDYGDTLYFVLYGQIRISKKILGAGEEALAILEPGEIFGEMALVSDNALRSADCFAHEGPILLLAFRKQNLETLPGKDKNELSFVQALCKMMVHRLREINGKLFNWKMMSGGFS